MILGIEVLVFCLLMFLISFLATGNDKKNLKSFKSYGKKLQSLLKEDEEYSLNIKEVSPITTFFSNFILFLIIVFIFGIFLRSKDFTYNFIALLILGESANAFDFFIIDIVWFSHTKRTRFSKYQDKALYQDVRNHFYSFIKGAVMFLFIALVDGSILTLF